MRFGGLELGPEHLRVGDGQGAIGGKPLTLTEWDVKEHSTSCRDDPLLAGPGPLLMGLMGVVRNLAGRYAELAVVAVAAVLGLTVQAPLVRVAGDTGIDVLLAVLVFATAVTIRPAALRHLPQGWRNMLAALVAGVTMLPILSWAVSRLVAAGSLRDGIMTVGLAPCEIASVATTSMAGGDAAASAGLLIGSTAATIAVAGPLLTIETGHSSIHQGQVALNLTLVVVLPLVVGLLVGTAQPVRSRTSIADTVATLSVAGLVAGIAAHVHLSIHYLAVTAALAVFLAGSMGLGGLLSRGTDRASGIAIVLTTSMRDFAIAAAIAAQAFGPAAAAPLGIYGILVLVWGTAAAGYLRSRSARRTPGGGRREAERTG